MAKTAIVTGSSRGIGRGIAVELARHGWNVAINYCRNRVSAEETSSDCSKIAKENGYFDTTFICLQADISDDSDRKKLVDQAMAAYGTVDALVNNAGIPTPDRMDITKATEHAFRTVLDTNLLGPFFLTQYMANCWLDSSGSPGEKRTCPKHILFITSISAETASTSRADYCISKAGLAMAAKLWAGRLAVNNILVYELRPGIIDTDMTAIVKDSYTSAISQGLVPQRRWGTPQDIGAAARSILDGDFAFSTGSVFHVDGGFHISRL